MDKKTRTLTLNVLIFLAAISAQAKGSDLPIIIGAYDDIEIRTDSGNKYISTATLGNPLEFKAIKWDKDHYFLKIKTKSGKTYWVNSTDLKLQLPTTDYTNCTNMQVSYDPDFQFTPARGVGEGCE